MSIKKEQIVSAEVLLKPSSGKAIDGQTEITAETIKDYEPAQETVVKVSKAFTNAGFEVGPMLGISFSITASISLFESFFKTSLIEQVEGGIRSVICKTTQSHELTLEALQKSLAELIVAVTFSPPPDFGPTDFMGSA